VFLVLRLKKEEIERERKKTLLKTIYLGEAETVYWHFLYKFYKFKSKTGSITIRVKSFPISRRFFGDVVIRFLQRHGIPFQVSYARKNFLRRITVLDIPKLKQIIEPSDDVIEELYSIIEELLNEYSNEGRKVSKTGK
jgi:hypothetical protein